jgi:Staphylococcal nuclease homologue
VFAQKLGTMCGIVAILCQASPALGDPCAVEADAGQSVTISDIRSDHRLTLADGRILQLAGLDLGSMRLPEMAGQEAILTDETPPDRHGAIHGNLFIEGEDVAATLAAKGLARTRPAVGEIACYTELISGEDNARMRSLGLWADPGYAVADAAVPEAVARHADDFALVTGKVLHVGTTKTIVWIDFGRVWREDVTIAVPVKQWPRFEAAGLTQANLEGARIRARGIVTMRDGPRIEITEPAAIEVIAPAQK